MKREIKFRGQWTHNKEWVCGSLMIDANGNTMIGSGGLVDVDPETVGQFTGLKDQGGRDIFEDDIVYAEVSAFGNFNHAYVKFANGEFCFYKPNGQRVIQVDTDCYSVIGNIHDNPDLLK